MSTSTTSQKREDHAQAREVGTRSDGSSKGLVDWLGDPRSFTPWVDRG
jgi:hypothetical protein